MLDTVDGATYSADVFNVADIRSAKNIILTQEGARSPDQRWETETPHLVSLIEQHLDINKNSIVLDYGCGIGRLSKALVNKFNCRVVGTDISPSMRALAAAYVSSDKFFVCAPEALSWLGIKFDAALAVWVLQHCWAPRLDIGLIKQCLYGRLFVLNEAYRCVPTRKHGWIDDHQDVFDLLGGANFALRAECKLDPAAMGDRIASKSLARVYQKMYRD